VVLSDFKSLLQCLHCGLCDQQEECLTCTNKASSLQTQPNLKYFQKVGQNRKQQFMMPVVSRSGSCNGNCFVPHLHSASSSSLIVGHTQLSTVADRAFPVAAARIWNSLPQHVTSVTSALSLLVFQSYLKTHLFAISYPSPLLCTVLLQ